jgi:hypothetical protein
MGVPAEKVVVVPEAIDTALYDPAIWQPLPIGEAAAAAKAGNAGVGGGDAEGDESFSPASSFTVLTVFRLHDRRGWAELLRAYVQVSMGGGCGGRGKAGENCMMGPAPGPETRPNNQTNQTNQTKLTKPTKPTNQTKPTKPNQPNQPNQPGKGRAASLMPPPSRAQRRLQTQP